MAAGAGQRPNTRKRNRKRKRRNVPSSSSSETFDSSESESDNERASTTIRIAQKRPGKAVVTSSGSSSSSESSADSNSSSESGQDLDTSTPFRTAAAEPVPKPASATDNAAPQHSSKSVQKARASSPDPPQNVPEPIIIDGDKTKEEALRARFRQFWLGSVADAFADDLNEIRKESNLTPARLSLLIDSLASGADVYSSSSRQNGKQINEMEVALGE